MYLKILNTIIFNYINMGCCYSYLETQNQNKLKLLETLNKTIDNLRLLQKEESRQQELLRSEKVNLEYEIHQEKNKLIETKEKHKTTIETIKMFECSICMDRLNKVMCIPCGHCFCLQCSKTLKECPICRSNITGINNIYFN